MNDLRKQLIQTGRHLRDVNLTWGTSGNMSARLADERMIITGSGTHMGDLGHGDFIECSIATGRALGAGKPSKEAPMHAGIYQARADAKAILHSSPFHSTVFACCDEEIRSELFVESMYYLEKIAYTDYFHPGTQALADAVSEQAPKANIIIMRHHGVVVFDQNVSEALVRMETLELACRMILLAKAAGVKLNRLPEAVVQSFLNDSGYRTRQVLPMESATKEQP